jgi:hypothetical protein
MEMEKTKGHSGGILVDIRDETLEVEETDVGDYFISMVLGNKLSNFRWELITGFGPAQHTLSSDFISELSRKCMTSTLPLFLCVWGGGGGLTWLGLLLTRTTPKNDG